MKIRKVLLRIGLFLAAALLQLTDLNICVILGRTG